MPRRSSIGFASFICIKLYKNVSRNNIPNETIHKIIPCILTKNSTVSCIPIIPYKTISINFENAIPMIIPHTREIAAEYTVSTKSTFDKCLFSIPKIL